MAAPIIVFMYQRDPRPCLEALARNRLASQSLLYISCDGPKDNHAQVQYARKQIRTSGFKRVEIIEYPHNVGLSTSIITGVSWMMGLHGRAIVIEDDLLVSPYFLEYMNRSLDLYEKKEEVISIHGYSYNIPGLPETFFLRGADCWGWATWQRGWELFETDAKKLLRSIDSSRDFDFDGSYRFTRMLKRVAAGKIDSWAIRWYASAYVRDKLTLYPGRSLVQNVGGGSMATHTKQIDWLKTPLSQKPVHLQKIPVREHREVRRKFADFFRHNRPSLMRELWQ